MGSPPQVRGKRVQTQTGISFPRITPAGAGKTPHPIRSLKSLQDHPRRCGENAFWCSLAAGAAGSPPQVRGKQWRLSDAEMQIGITPAGAGKTLSVRLTPSAFQDHPRRCGENNRIRGCTENFTGSPPQVRGKPSRNTAKRILFGITPAGAGKTPRLCLPW